MTAVQSMMLAVCFGAVMGTFIGNAVFLIKCAIETTRKRSVKKSLLTRQSNRTGRQEQS